MTRRRFLIVVLIFLLIVLAALIVGFLAFRNQNAGPAAAKTPGFVHVRTIYGWGKEPQDLFVRPFGAVYNSGSLYVVDKERSQVIKMTPTGTLQQIFGSFGAKPEQMNQPTGVAVDGGGNVYVSDGGAKRILVFSQEGKYLRAVRLDAQPLALTIADKRMFVTTADSVKILSLPTLDQLASWGSIGKGREQFEHPNGIAFDPATGTIYVSDGNNLRVKAMDQQGRIQWIFGEPPANMNDVGPTRRFGLAGGVALAQGYLFVADPLDATIHVLNLKGEEVAQLGDMGEGDGQFNNPVMVASTNGKELAVTEWGNGRVQIFQVDPQQAIAAYQEQEGKPVTAGGQ